MGCARSIAARGSMRSESPRRPRPAPRPPDGSPAAPLHDTLRDFREEGTMRRLLGALCLMLVPVTAAAQTTNTTGSLSPNTSVTQLQGASPTGGATTTGGTTT